MTGSLQATFEKAVPSLERIAREVEFLCGLPVTTRILYEAGEPIHTSSEWHGEIAFQGLPDLSIQVACPNIIYCSNPSMDKKVVFVYPNQDSVLEWVTLYALERLGGLPNLSPSEHLKQYSLPLDANLLERRLKHRKFWVGLCRPFQPMANSLAIAFILLVLIALSPIILLFSLTMQ